MPEIYRPIQIIPPGFLGFFNLKNEGKNPSEIPSLLTPTVELQKWYLNSSAQKMSATNATRNLTNDLDGFAIPTANVITVPDGEWWYVHNLIGWAILPAAANEAVQFAMGWVEPNNFLDFEVPQPPSPLLTSSAAVTRRYFSVASDFWAPPGAVFFWFLTTAETATNIPAFLNGRITPLPV